MIPQPHRPFNNGAAGPGTGGAVEPAAAPVTWPG